MFKCDRSLEELKSCADWDYVFFLLEQGLSFRGVINYNGSIASFKKRDIDVIVALQSDPTDDSDCVTCELNMIGAFILNDGRFVMIRSAQDYSGLYDFAEAQFASSLKDLIRFGMTNEERQRFEIDLSNF